MSADLRGFEYVGEPVLSRRRWQLDATAGELARAIERLAAARSRLAGLREELATQAAASGPTAASLDPGARSRALSWLASLQGRIVASERELGELESGRTEVAERLRTLQGQVEALETHRDDARKAFSAEVATQAATQADRDWLGRSAARDIMRLKA